MHKNFNAVLVVIINLAGEAIFANWKKRRKQMKLYNSDNSQNWHNLRIRERSFSLNKTACGRLAGHTRLINISEANINKLKRIYININPYEPTQNTYKSIHIHRHPSNLQNKFARGSAPEEVQRFDFEPFEALVHYGKCPQIIYFCFWARRTAQSTFN